MRHPCLVQKGINFIPNDIKLGLEEKNNIRIMLITGSNMGGKSTYLRMCCIAAILA